jgi:hypothetical protein
MLKTFSLVKKGDFHILRKRTFPRLKARVDLRKLIPEIKDIDFLDCCSVAEEAQAITEVGVFLESFNLEC